MKRTPLSILPLGLAVAAWLVPAAEAAAEAAKPEGAAAAAASAEPVKDKASGFRLFGKKKEKVAETTAASANPKAGGTGTAVGVMADYAAQVRGLGCDVIVVPVPPKALVYPDKVVRKAKIPVKRKVVPRLDSSWAAAMKSLESRGMTTVDLLPVFLAHRGDKEGAPYTQTGNTWSPRGVQLAAEAVAAAVKRSRAAKVAGSVQGISAEPGSISYTGSLAAGANPAVKAETLSLRNIGRISGDKVRSVSFSTSGGGLLLMGDSSILAWRESGNPAGSSGSFSSLADQVAAELQAIPDVLSVPGDGRNAPRLRIMRERTSGRGTLSGTKAIVWVIPMTDLASPAWQQVPLQLSFSLDQPEIMLR